MNLERLQGCFHLPVFQTRGQLRPRFALPEGPLSWEGGHRNWVFCVRWTTAFVALVLSLARVLESPHASFTCGLFDLHRAEAKLQAGVPSRWRRWPSCAVEEKTEAGRQRVMQAHKALGTQAGYHVEVGENPHLVHHRIHRGA
ncbi:hypothetical protein KP509_38G033100 [Ceratopteris richardii]|uniref:Uncharacterized protein n=1 Tax=Ceratopteris richardii TaxID=49495 RepID=A0A8T2Q2T2_CERRI|nr:hypothetical protein KP509_38G033100 [Ceratopteris richardii]